MEGGYGMMIDTQKKFIKFEGENNIHIDNLVDMTPTMVVDMDPTMVIDMRPTMIVDTASKDRGFEE